MTVRTCPISEARAKIGRIVATVEGSGVPVVITHRGEPGAVVVSVADFELLQVVKQEARRP